MTFSVDGTSGALDPLGGSAPLLILVLAATILAAKRPRARIRSAACQRPAVRFEMDLGRSAGE